jgi:ribose transport system substrate-binding protein
MRQTIVFIAALVLFVLLSVLLFFFGQTINKMTLTTQTVDQENVKPNAYHFVLISEQFDNPYWRSVEQGAQDAAKERHVTLEYMGPFRSNIDDHLKILDQAIAAKVDGILVQGLIDSLYAPVINKAIERGIPVITVDTDAPSSKRMSYVGTDNYQAGLDLGKEVVRILRGKGRIAIITGTFGTTNQEMRVKGIKDAVRDAEIQIVTIRSSQISRIQATEQTNQILSVYPDLDAIVGTSATDALGIYDAVKERSNTHLKIIGFDDLTQTLTLLNEGKIAATIIQKPYWMGYRAVNLLADVKEGKTIQPRVYTGTQILERKDVIGR